VGQFGLVVALIRQRVHRACLTINAQKTQKTFATSHATNFSMFRIVAIIASPQKLASGSTNMSIVNCRMASALSSSGILSLKQMFSCLDLVLQSVASSTMMKHNHCVGSLAMPSSTATVATMLLHRMMKVSRCGRTILRSVRTTKSVYLILTMLNTIFGFTLKRCVQHQRSRVRSNWLESKTTNGATISSSVMIVLQAFASTPVCGLLLKR